MRPTTSTGSTTSPVTPSSSNPTTAPIVSTAMTPPTTRGAKTPTAVSPMFSLNVRPLRENIPRTEESSSSTATGTTRNVMTLQATPNTQANT